MRKNFILDTNVLLHDPNAIFHFADNTVILPIEVIEELDNFKRDLSDLGQNARMVAVTLDRLRRKGRLGEGVPLDNGGLLRVMVEDLDDGPPRGRRAARRTDNRILDLAIQLNDQDPDTPAIIITKSINLRLKADAIGIYAEDFEENEDDGLTPYLGYHELSVPGEQVRALREKAEVTLAGPKLRPHEFVALTSDNGERLSAMGRVHPRDTTRVMGLRPVESDGILGISPLNLAQAFALDALLNDEVKLVTLTGKAGTGKTLLAVAAGLYKVFKEDQYNRVLVSRPTLPMGRDIGFIPGDVAEKMRPWMQPIFDAIELIRELDRRGRQRVLPPDLLESQDIAVEPLTYIRGRSIPHQYMIIDEAQNLTPLEVKTIITRVGMHTKIILTGDPYQIDNPYVDAVSNGLVYVVNRFRSSTLAAHVTLTRGERSELAELAANLL